jgi:hypothetical protein
MDTLEQRVATLERELTALKAQVEQQPAAAKDWRRSVGVFTDDPVFEEMVREGRKYREQEREPD